MKVLSTLVVLFICQSVFGQYVPAEEFRLDREYLNQQIVQQETIRISP